MKPIRCIVVCLAMLAMVTPLFSSTRGNNVQKAASVSESFTSLEQALVALERGLAQIERSGSITAEFDVESSLDNYYREANTTFENTMEAVIEDAKTMKTEPGGTMAAGDRLAAWEDKIIGHRSRVEKIVIQLTDINLRIRDGRVMFSPDLVRSFSNEEKEELRNWLTPETLRRYDGLLGSDILQRRGRVVSAGSIGRPALIATPAIYTTGSQPTGVRAAAAVAAASPAGPAAKPAVAAVCVAVCSNPITAPEACLPCVIAAVGVGSFLATQIENGLQACNSKRTRVGRAVCKAGVILGFIVIIG